MNPVSAPYRTLFLCELEQCSALSVGGGDEAGPSDQPLLRDAHGDLLIRGASLAGALAASARAILGELPAGISDDGSNAGSGTPSLWDFDHGFPLYAGASRSELRAGSPHRQDTRTAAAGGLHDIEVIPLTGTTFRFLLQVSPAPANLSPDRVDTALIAALALREWAAGRCWLGRKVARGLGWLKLVHCTVRTLDRQHVDDWPDSSCESLAARYDAGNKIGSEEELASYLVRHKGEVDFLLEEARRKSLPGRRRYLRWTGVARVGEYKPDGETKTYGLDTLEIGGHGSAGVLPESLGNHFVKGDDLKNDALRKISPDTVLALTQVQGHDKQVVWQPFVPGTAFAGSFRHWLSREQRRGGSKVWDPVAQTAYAEGEPEAGSEDDQDTVELLLGGLRQGPSKTVRRASSLLFREAHLTKESRRDWTVACVEGVRIDPYTQKSAEGAKFNRSALLNAAFDWELVLEIADGGNGAAPDMDKTQTEMVEAFLAAAARSRVSLGGGEFRGHGHLAFSVSKRERAAAGEEGWSEWNRREEEK